MATKSPAISVLTPVWNGLPYIKECVESVLTQEYQDWEFIISDNGSTDGTRDYLDTLTDPRIQIFKQEKNLGIDGNLNFLFTKAKGPIAYMLCADDYFYAGALDKVMESWRTASPETGYIAYNWKTVLKEKDTAQSSYYLLPKKLTPETSQLAFFLFGNLPGNLSNVCAKVDVVNKYGGFSEHLRMAGDFEIWARLAKHQEMLLSDDETIFLRRHEGTASNYLNKQGRLFQEHIIIYESLIDDLSRYYDRQQLIDYFNIQICSFHLREAIRALLFHGRIANLKMYYTVSSKIFWSKWKRCVVMLPYAIFEASRLKRITNTARGLLKQPRKNLSHT